MRTDRLNRKFQQNRRNTFLLSGSASERTILLERKIYISKLSFQTDRDGSKNRFFRGKMISNLKQQIVQYWSTHCREYYNSSMIDNIRILVLSYCMLRVSHFMLNLENVLDFWARMALEKLQHSK